MSKGSPDDREYADAYCQSRDGMRVWTPQVLSRDLLTYKEIVCRHCHACCKLPFGTFPVVWLELERHLSLSPSRSDKIRAHQHRLRFPMKQVTAVFLITIIDRGGWLGMCNGDRPRVAPGGVDHSYDQPTRAPSESPPKLRPRKETKRGDLGRSSSLSQKGSNTSSGLSKWGQHEVN